MREEALLPALGKKVIALPHKQRQARAGIHSG